MPISPVSQADKRKAEEHLEGDSKESNKQARTNEAASVIRTTDLQRLILPTMTQPVSLSSREHNSENRLTEEVFEKTINDSSLSENSSASLTDIALPRFPGKGAIFSYNSQDEILTGSAGTELIDSRVIVFKSTIEDSTISEFQLCLHSNNSVGCQIIVRSDQQNFQEFIETELLGEAQINEYSDEIGYSSCSRAEAKKFFDYVAAYNQFPQLQFQKMKAIVESGFIDAAVVQSESDF